MNSSLVIAKNNIKAMGKVAVCFSGGMDSTALLSISKEAKGSDVTAIFVDVPMLSERQRDIALTVAAMLDCRLVTVKLEWDDLENILQNGEDRCTLCRNAIYSAAMKAAEKHGVKRLLYGDLSYPGYEFRNVSYPLADANVTKTVIKEYVDSLSLPLDLVKDTCLLARFQTGHPVTEDDLETVEDLEYGIISISSAKLINISLNGRNIIIKTDRDGRKALEESKEELTYYLDSIGYSYEIMEMA